jgi:hypothetical protein
VVTGGYFVDVGDDNEHGLVIRRFNRNTVSDVGVKELAVVIGSRHQHHPDQIG